MQRYKAIFMSRYFAYSNTAGQQLQYNIWVELLEQTMFQLVSKCRQRISQNDVVRQAVPANTQVSVILSNTGSWTSRLSVVSTKIIGVEFTRSQPWSHRRQPVPHTSPRCADLDISNFDNCIQLFNSLTKKLPKH